MPTKEIEQQDKIRNKAWLADLVKDHQAEL